MKVYELFEQQTWRAIDVVRNILGADNVIDDKVENPESAQPHQFIVTHSWVNSTPDMFSDLDCESGVVCLADRYGTTPAAIAKAAHESFHAWLHQNKQPNNNEKLVNQLATEWLRKHFSGMFLRAALDTILKSKIHYGHN